MEIEPSSEITIDEASAGADGSTVLLMTQKIGRTWHVVTHLLSGGSRYEVRSPASTASVRGTQFAVVVAEDAMTTVTTSEGRVATSDPAKTVEVIVTAGLTTTTKKGEIPTPPVPAPEPQRRVIVTVADPNALVVDPLGRANGFKDGKLVIQTPGALVRIEGGNLVVTMPDLPDGALSAHVEKKNGGGTVVETTVEDRGSAPVTSTEKVPDDGTGTVGVEVRSGDGKRPSVEPVKGDLPKPKVGTVPAAPSPGSGGSKASDAESTAPGATAPTEPGQTERRTLEPAPTQVAERTADATRVPQGDRTPAPMRTPKPTGAAGDRPVTPAASSGAGGPKDATKEATKEATKDTGAKPPSSGFSPNLNLQLPTFNPPVAEPPNAAPNIPHGDGGKSGKSKD